MHLASINCRVASLKIDISVPENKIKNAFDLNIMSRAPFQVLVLPYRKTDNSFEFAVFCRADRPCWQGIAGGGEDHEVPLESAIREASEEGGISKTSHFTILQATSSVPVDVFKNCEHWDSTLFVIPEYSFGVDCTGQQLIRSDEHVALEWVSFDVAHNRLTYDSNRNALWELNSKVRGWGPR